MGQVLHGSATTTETIRRAIQHSQASLRALSKRYGINRKTVAKWRQRTSVADQCTGPKDPHSTVLSPEDEAVVVGLSASHAPAAGRLPLCAAGHDPAPDPLVAASLPAAPWDQPIAGGRRRQTQAVALQGLSARLLPYRSGRGSHGRRPALPARRHRSYDQVRLRAIAREGDAANSYGISSRPCPTRCTRCSPTTALTSPRRATSLQLPPSSGKRLQPARHSGPTASSPLAPETISIIACQSRVTPGPTVRSSE